MKSTGIVRWIDSLGRIVIPKELRDTLGIEAFDKIEIYADRDTILLHKAGDRCHFCGAEVQVEMFQGKPVCRGCLKAAYRKIQREVLAEQTKNAHR